MADFERLWAPWRIGYVAGGESAAAPVVEPAAWVDGAERSCFLCRAAASYDDQLAASRHNLTVGGALHAVALVNRYPYNNGHLLVSPRRHVAELDQLTAEERLATLDLLTHFTRLLTKLIKAEGFNIGLNLGRVAGAGVPGHLHWHLVPRWTGDSNLMPVTAGTRVISQSLEALYDLLVSNPELRE